MSEGPDSAAEARAGSNPGGAQRSARWRASSASLSDAGGGFAPKAAAMAFARVSFRSVSWASAHCSPSVSLAICEHLPASHAAPEVLEVGAVQLVEWDVEGLDDGLGFRARVGVEGELRRERPGDGRREQPAPLLGLERAELEKPVPRGRGLQPVELQAGGLRGQHARPGAPLRDGFPLVRVYAFGHVRGGGDLDRQGSVRLPAEDGRGHLVRGEVEGELQVALRAAP